MDELERRVQALELAAMTVLAHLPRAVGEAAMAELTEALGEVGDPDWREVQLQALELIDTALMRDRANDLGLVITARRAQLITLARWHHPQIYLDALERLGLDGEAQGRVVAAIDRNYEGRPQSLSLVDHTDPAMFDAVWAALPPPAQARLAALEDVGSASASELAERARNKGAGGFGPEGPAWRFLEAARLRELARRMGWTGAA